MNRKAILFLTIFFLATLSFYRASAQQDVRIKRGAFRIENKEGFKSAWKHRRQGDKYYDKGYGFYEKALDHFNKAHRYNPDHAGLNYKIGLCYFEMGQY